jgi:hypothetical protein
MSVRLFAPISQLTFPIETQNAIFTANPSLYPKGIDSLNFSGDNIFADGHEFQLATPGESMAAASYDSFLQVAVEGSGTTGIGHIERETLKVFELEENFPNSCHEYTTIPSNLKQGADLKLELWDLSGRKVSTIMEGRHNSGEFQIEINPGKMGLPHGNYIYQLEAKNRNGTFRLPKMMTAV